jgi:hypothetical protein
MNEEIIFLKNQMNKLIDKNSIILNIGNLSNQYMQVFSELAHDTINITDDIIEDNINQNKFINIINFNNNIHAIGKLQNLIVNNTPLLLFNAIPNLHIDNIKSQYTFLNELGYEIYDISPVNNINDAVGPLSYDEFIYYTQKICTGNFLGVYKNNIKKYNLPTIVKGKTCAIVFGKNDKYKENDRFLIHLTTMLNAFDEVIYVDWNSPEKSHLYEIINQIPKTGRLKHFIINSFTSKILTNFDPKLYTASSGGLSFNLALRRTDAEHVVITGMDIISPTKKLLTDFINQITNKHSFYTLSRREVNYETVIENKNNLNNYIDFLNQTSSPRYDPVRVTQNDNYSIFGCPGDFQFAHKNVWLKIKGYEEKMKYACYGDTNAQKKAVLYGFDLVPIYNVPLYHMSHKGMSNDGTSPSKNHYNDPIEWVENFNQYKKYNHSFISRNTDTWGFSDIEIEYEVI